MSSIFLSLIHIYRTVGLIENGTWAPLAAKVMKEMLSKCKKINWLNTTVKIMSAVKEENRRQMDAMADELCQEYIAKSDDLADKNDMTALFRIGYGLYVVTSNDGKKDNGLIVNTVTQLTDNPYRVAVNINKACLLYTSFSFHSCNFFQNIISFSLTRFLFIPCLQHCCLLRYCQIRKDVYKRQVLSLKK